MAKEMDHIPEGWHEVAMHTVNGKAVYLVEKGPQPETVSGSGDSTESNDG